MNASTHIPLHPACPPLGTVRILLIGLGNRGRLAAARLLRIPGAVIAGICDIDAGNLEIAEKMIRDAGHRPARSYCGPGSWEEACRTAGTDLAYICTDWQSHCRIAVAAMECGMHAAVEVPAATTVAECWELVRTSERCRRHCMMLENCCYDAFSLTAGNLVRAGLLGEIVHAEGAYIHDLREYYFAPPAQGGCRGDWIRQYSRYHTGNPYPTHGLGPVCQWLDIHRGDRLVSLVSMSSRQAGLSRFAARRFGAGSDEARTSFEMGDFNDTLIRTAQGRTIHLQYNVTTPRPYSRSQTLCGTEGFFQKYPLPCLQSDRLGPRALTGEELTEALAPYRHPFTEHLGSLARQAGMDNEMNFIMDCRLIHCLRRGKPLDLSVYDAALWSSVAELSEWSVRHGSEPVEIPDFTCGRWK